MKRPLNILHIEDNKAEAHLILHELKSHWAVIDFCRVDKMTDLQEALKKKWDIILSDYDLPCFTGIDALRLISDHGIDTPFIMVTGRFDDEIKDLAIGLGAVGYIVKGDMEHMVLAISGKLKAIDGN